MATHRIPIVNGFALVGANVRFEPAATNFGANDRYKHGVFVFPDTATKDVLGGSFVVPQNYVGTAAIVIVHATTATSGNVLWDFDYTAVGSSETGDPSSDQENVTSGSVAADGTARDITFTTVNLTSANLAVGDTVLFNFGRDGVNEASGIAANVYVLGLFFQYADA